MTTAVVATDVFSQFLANLESAATAVEDKIVAFADKFIPEVENDLELGLEDIATFAVNAVLEAATLAITGQEKFGTAVTNVVQAVEATGKTVLVQTAQTAVQQAYLLVQAKAAAATPAH